MDPIEKKPLFHFLPGSRAYSIATVGCNFRCRHCQNSAISQYPHLHDGRVDGAERTPAEVVAAAQALDCASVCYTYVEPTIFYEFAYDCACLAKAVGLANVFVSNGYMTPEVIHHLAPVLDGINIDVKFFRDDTYRQICKARLQPVLDAVQLFHRLGVWVEVTTLVIPGLNDSAEELGEIADFICSVSPTIPWHVSAFHPAYQLTDRGATPPATLTKARQIGLERGLAYVYVGNIPGGGGEDTICPQCKTPLLERWGFSIQASHLDGDRCRQCGHRIPGVFNL